MPLVSLMGLRIAAQGAVMDSMVVDNITEPHVTLGT